MPPWRLPGGPDCGDWTGGHDHRPGIYWTARGRRPDPALALARRWKGAVRFVPEVLQAS